jgi:hypothetical protein
MSRVSEKLQRISKISELFLSLFSLTKEEETTKSESVKIVICKRPPQEPSIDNTPKFEESSFNEDSNDQPMDASHEEYLEEVMDQEPLVTHDENSYESIPPDIQEFSCDIKEEPVEITSFSCSYCEKTFASRSGRDTHQQIKHRCPEDVELLDFTPHQQKIEIDGKMSLIWQCPHCDHYSKKKDHHRTHLIRHAIREKEEVIKQELEGGYSIEESEEAQVVWVVEDKSQENLRFAPPAIKDKPKDCRLVLNGEDSMFFCSECHSQFPDEKRGNQHVQKFGSTGLCSSCVCYECQVVFPSSKLLQRHHEYHTIAGVAHHLNYFECLTCSVVFSNQIDLDVHLQYHVVLPKQGKESYQFIAEFNNKLDGCELQTLNLREEWMGTGRLRCGYCSKVAVREEMNVHMTFFHAQLKCPFDNQFFGRSLGYFVDHLKWKHPGEFQGVELSFKCSFCPETFGTLSAMKLHCKTCSEKRFSCTHCDKKFFMERQLKHHLALVNGVKNHKCTTCEKSFTNKTELNVHSRVHSDEKPYQCTFPGCTKAFRTNSHRSSHMDTHSSSENYQCAHCTKRFKTRGARRIHEKSHDESQCSLCPICRKEFRQRSHMIRHVNVIHHVECTSGNLEDKVATQIQKVESTVDEGSG